MKKQERSRKNSPTREQLVDRCLRAFVASGTLDLSLDELAKSARTSKRMLVHYFGGREAIEEQALSRLEDRLRAQFAPESFPPGVSLKAVVKALWDQTTSPDAQGVLRLVMDVSRRAWRGSARARAFYEEQQRLWVGLLMRYLPDEAKVEEVLHLFQGAVLAYLVTGDSEPGMRCLMRVLATKPS
jgi:AcrR family transcriptional regulator